MHGTRARVLPLVAVGVLTGAALGFLARPLFFAPVSDADSVAATPDLRTALDEAEAIARGAAEAAARAERAAAKAEHTAGTAERTAGAARLDSSAARTIGTSALERVERLERDALRQRDVDPDRAARGVAELERKIEDLSATMRQKSADAPARPTSVPSRPSQPTMSATNAVIGEDEVDPVGECAAEGVFVVERMQLPFDQLRELDELWPGARAAMIRIRPDGVRLVGGIDPSSPDACSRAAFLRAEDDARVVGAAWTHDRKLWFRSLGRDSRPVRVVGVQAGGPLAAAVVDSRVWIFYQDAGRVRFARSESLEAGEFAHGVVGDGGSGITDLKLHQEGNRLWLTWRADERTLELAVLDEDTGQWAGLERGIVADDLSEALDQARVWALRAGTR